MLLLKTLKTSAITLNVIAMPNIIKEYVPKVVNAPAPEFAVASQNRVENPVKNSPAKSDTKHYTIYWN